MKLLSPPHTDQRYTCERRLLQLACRSLCIPSYSRCYLSIGKYHGNSRARLPHRRGRGELRLRNFGTPQMIVSPHRNALHDECRGVWALCRHSKNACCSLITPVPRSSDENSSCNTKRLCAGAKGELSLSLQLRTAMARAWLLKNVQTCSKRLFVTQRSFEKTSSSWCWTGR